MKKQFFVIGLALVAMTVVSCKKNQCSECHTLNEFHHEIVDNQVRECDDCHKPGDDGKNPKACQECHEEGEVGEMEVYMDLKSKMNAFHIQCDDCHKKNDAGPEDKEKRCKWCHNNNAKYH